MTSSSVISNKSSKISVMDRKFEFPCIHCSVCCVYIEFVRENSESCKKENKSVLQYYLLAGNLFFVITSTTFSLCRTSGPTTAILLSVFVDMLMNEYDN